MAAPPARTGARLHEGRRLDTFEVDRGPSAPRSWLLDVAEPSIEEVRQYFGVPFPISELLRSLTLCGVVGVGSVFNSLALELASTLPRFNRLFLWFALLSSGAGAVFLVLGRESDGLATAQVGGLVLIASLF